MTTFTALVLAASRRGADDPVARMQGLSHKCLVPVAGKPMIHRVIETLRATPEIGWIFVSIENADVLQGITLPPGVILVPSRATLADSVTAAVAEMSDDPWPLLITTADNALHTSEMLSSFCAATNASAGDVTVAMTPAEIILARYPSGQRAFHRFKDGAASSCNLYALRNARSVAAAKAFAGGGQFGKKPWRLLAAFGVMAFVLYKLRRMTLDQAMTRIGRVFDLDVRAVRMPFAEAPIDIDTPADHALAEQILNARDVTYSRQ